MVNCCFGRDPPPLQRVQHSRLSVHTDTVPHVEFPLACRIQRAHRIRVRTNVCDAETASSRELPEAPRLSNIQTRAVVLCMREGAASADYSCCYASSRAVDDDGEHYYLLQCSLVAMSSPSKPKVQTLNPRMHTPH